MPHSFLNMYIHTCTGTYSDFCICPTSRIILWMSTISVWWSRSTANANMENADFRTTGHELPRLWTHEPLFLKCPFDRPTRIATQRVCVRRSNESELCVEIEGAGRHWLWQYLQLYAMLNFNLRQAIAANIKHSTVFRQAIHIRSACLSLPSRCFVCLCRPRLFLHRPRHDYIRFFG